MASRRQRDGSRYEETASTNQYMRLFDLQAVKEGE